MRRVLRAVLDRLLDGVFTVIAAMTESRRPM